MSVSAVANTTPFKVLQCTTREQDGFSFTRSYPILEVYQRGNYQINGVGIAFEQTTFKVKNDSGEDVYVPYNSDYFIKKK